MEKTLRIPLSGDCPVLLRGSSSFLLVGCAEEKFPLIIGTEDEELVQGVYPGDLVIVSAPEGGEIPPALHLLEMVRRYHIPVIALTKDHPLGKRLSYVVSVADKIQMRCDIRRGTHPDQHLLCSAEEFTGMVLHAEDNELVIEHCHGEITSASLRWNLSIIEEKTASE